MFKIRYFALLLAVAIAFVVVPPVGVYAGTPTATPKPTATLKPSRTPRPSSTPRPTATPSRTATSGPTLPSDPVMPLSEPQDFVLRRPPDNRIFAEGTLTLRYPDGWAAMAGPWGSVLIASDVTTMMAALVQTPEIDSEQVLGEVFFSLPEHLSAMALSKTAKPISVLNRFFSAGKEPFDIRESKSNPESFTLDGKEGVATVYHCRHCTGYEYYMVVVKANNGYAFALFAMKDLTIKTFRNTFRAVVASVTFRKAARADQNQAASLHIKGS